MQNMYVHNINLNFKKAFYLNINFNSKIPLEGNINFSYEYAKYIFS